MFNTNLQDTYQNFTFMHLMPLIVIALLIILMIRYKHILANYPKIPFILAGLTIIQEISLNLFRLLTSTWSIGTSLPFHLCGFGVIISSYLLITKKVNLFKQTFFILLLGALMALLTPSIDDNYGFPHYRYFQFFVSHGLITINLIYMLIVLNYHNAITYKDLMYNLRTLFIIGLVVTPINLLFDGNYLFLMGVPGENTAFELFGPWPWYLINIALFGIPILFHLAYLPFYVRNQIKQKSV